jgi:TonB-dependent starch-binding outer membrane protein SusC
LDIDKFYRFLGVDPATGLYQFEDSHGSPTSTPDYESDRTVMLSTLPVFYGGFQNTIAYRAFELDFLLQFVKKIAPNSSYLNNGSSTAPGVFRGLTAGSNQPASVIDRWQKPGDNMPIMKYSSIRSALLDVLSAAQGSDAFHSNASYVRLKNVSISWRLPSTWRQRMHLKSGNIFVHGQNLLTITKYRGMDPENPQGSDYFLPPLRILTVGVKMSL